MVFSKVFSRFSKVSSILIFGICFSLLFAISPVSAQTGGDTGGDASGDTGGTDTGEPDYDPMDPNTPDDMLQEGDIVGEYDVTLNNADGTLGNTPPGTQLAETTSVAESADCDELSDYYAYRQDRDEVQCTREGGPGSCDFHCKEVRVDGCFAPDTLILMGDGVSTKRIDDIRTGDLVWNPTTDSAVRVVKVARGPELNPLIEIGYGTTVTRVTEKHPMVTQRGVEKLFHQSSMGAQASSFNARVKMASEITSADRILGADGEFHQVSVVRTLPVSANQFVINIEVDGATEGVQDHLLVADGIITGDYFVQKQLAGAK